MIADGISYLEIASNYLNGEWSDALNSYWSPLYSWAIALAFALLRPRPYWQLATLHLVNFLGFSMGLVTLQWLLRELTLFRRQSNRTTQQAGSFVVVDARGVSAATLYFVGYIGHIYAGLFLIGTAFCSPDMLAMFLTYALGALTIRMLRAGAETWTFIAAGILFGLSFLARTAFITLAPVYLIVFFVILRNQKRAWLRPLALTISFFVLLGGPFVAAISAKQHRFTIGDSGRLNYSWEIDGAARWMHWQGEPYDIGKPLHSTTKISDSPIAYVFDSDQPGTYPPWYNPAYWYEGIKPHLKFGPQIKIFLFNLSYATRLLLTFPLTIPALLLLIAGGLALFGAGLLQWWPLSLPPISGILIYCLVFLDRRYVAGYLVLLWLSLLCGISIQQQRSQKIINAGLQASHVLFIAILIFVQFRVPARFALGDLTSGRERERNLHYVLAKRFAEIGLNPGDKIAYVGVTFNADWTRLDKVKIVGEVPVKYVRRWKLFSSNVSHDDLSQLEQFWKLGAEAQNRILDGFKRAGAKMVVTDGSFSQEAHAHGWKTALSPNEAGLPFSEGQGLSQIGTRYLWLTSF